MTNNNFNVYIIPLSAKVKWTAKLNKFGATRCQILRLKCTKFDFRWGSAPDPLERLQRSPDPVAVFKGPIFKGREEKGTGSKKKGENKGKGKGGEGRGRAYAPDIYSFCRSNFISVTGAEDRIIQGLSYRHFVSHKNNLNACHHTGAFSGRQICQNCFCGRGSAPDPAGELIALPRPPSWKRGGVSGMERDREGNRKKGKGCEGKGSGGKQRSVCRELGLEMTPHYSGWKFLSGGQLRPPPVPIQQDQHNVQMISKYGTFHSSFEDRKVYCIWLQEMKPLND